VSLGAWILAVLFVDLVWPILVARGWSTSGSSPGITAFTPLDFYDYPITHSLVGGVVGRPWSAPSSGSGRGRRRRTRCSLASASSATGLLDAIVHRPDLPVLPAGPFVGLGLWHSVAGTLAVELSLFAAGLALYLRGAPRPRLGFWLLMGFLLIAYLGAAFGPPPPGRHDAGRHRARAVAARAGGVVGGSALASTTWSDSGGRRMSESPNRSSLVGESPIRIR
jgi:hypothetical protein